MIWRLVEILVAGVLLFWLYEVRTYVRMQQKRERLVKRWRRQAE